MLILTSPPPHPRLHLETCFPGTSNVRQACLWQKNPASSRSYPLLTWESKGDLEKCNTCCHSLLLCLSLMTSAIPGPPCCCFCHKKSHTPHTIGPILAPVFVAQRLHPSRQKAPLQPTLHRVSCCHRSEHNEGGLSRVTSHGLFPCSCSDAQLSDVRDPTDCNLPGSSVHGIFQARILAWVAISSSRGSS